MRRLPYAYEILHNAAVATGDGALLELWNLNDGAFGKVAFQIEGISGDTITFEGSIDGSTYYALAVTPIASSGTEATTATADGIWFPTRVAGLRYVRARLTRVSGTVTVVAVAVAA